jgi:hypothetical protein
VYKFSRHSRDLGLAKASLIVKPFWLAALASVISIAGIVAKINPGKPVGSSTGSVSSQASSNSVGNSGYNVISPSLAPPPGVPVSPQQGISSAGSGSTQSAQPPVATGGS